MYWINILLEYIDELPLENSPMVFGLHANAEIGYFTEAVKNMWSHMIDLQPQTGISNICSIWLDFGPTASFTFMILISMTAAGGGAQGRDHFVDSTAHDILRKLPPLYEMDILRKKYGLTPSPTTIVLLQEVERFNSLIERIRRTLTTLRRAIAGEVGMDAVLDNVSSSLYNGLIPDTWLKLAPATRKPLGSWMNHFFRRFAQYEQWVCECEQNKIVLKGLNW